MKLCLHKQRRARRHKPIKKKPRLSRLDRRQAFRRRRPVTFAEALTMPYVQTLSALRQTSDDIYADVARSIYG